MSMLEQFFSLDYANRGDLFEGLAIWEEEKYRNLQGTYPVINVSFARVKERDYTMAKEKICEIIRDLFCKFSYIKGSDKLSDYLYRYYGKKVIILLDEYDTPMQEAYVSGFWEEFVIFTRSMFNSAFKTNPYLARADMTL